MTLFTLHDASCAGVKKAVRAWILSAAEYSKATHYSVEAWN
jgi:hypothetical protein